MDRPYIICHMVTSVDGKVTGDFLYMPRCEAATQVYYDINRSYKSNGFICGRVTMESSFTEGWYPDLEGYGTVNTREDFIPPNASDFYAVCFDPKGKLGWKENKIIDDDPGYGGARIIEVLTNNVDNRYLAYLREKEIPYIFAGETEIDVLIALSKLKQHFGIDALLLEGGSIVNGYFERADAIDEISLVVAPLSADKNDKPLFMDGKAIALELKDIKQYNEGVVWMNYRRK
ncbi:MAG: dihydrofolate reductase family protein [Clostridia bacterium]|nr:dihydrofolate reductase family protein [Clostridia bacterium]